MAESDEGNVLLEDDSMDEMHELEDDLVASVDTNASPVKASVLKSSPRRGRHDSDDDSGEKDGGSDSDESASFGDSSSDGDDSSDGHFGVRATAQSAETERNAGPRVEAQDSDEDDEDEPPEIPGSPLRTGSADATPNSGRMNRLGDVDISKCGDIARSRQRKEPKVDILRLEARESDGDVDDDDYESKEAEAPRAMQFHSSSSSSGTDHDASDSDDDGNRFRNTQPPTTPKLNQQRPKTAAKELAAYRDVMPRDYYEQIVNDAPRSPAKATSQRTDPQQKANQEPRGSQASESKYKLRVPHEIEELFQFVEVFTPEPEEIPTRLQPFIPEYVPAVGLPFDGIQIPRPDGKPDESGVGFVREPCANSNAAELELLVSVGSKKQRNNKYSDVVERVHSIEDAAHRPKEIDQWIASVAKVHMTKPPPQVLYKKPMPRLNELMELWPEELEQFLQSQSPIAIGSLDVSLPDLVRVVCGVLDIPVFDGHHIHSLHVLFSLYDEIAMYEKEVLGRADTDR